MPKKEITCDVLKVLNESEARGNKVRLQIVSWNKRSPQLEKREYYQKEDEEEKMGKAKGMNLDDLSIIWDKADDIEKIMDQKF